MRLKRYSQTRLALGSDATITLVTAMPSVKVRELFKTLWRHVHTFERSFSRFIPMSELSAFNRSAGLRIPISDEFHSLLIAAKNMSEKTGGLFNPFILPALQRAGYVRSAVPGYESDAVDDYSDRAVVDIDALEIGSAWASIPYGTALDIGGCGKGYLADQLREVLARHDVVGYWVSLGGDVATGGYDEDGTTWKVYIQDAGNLSSEKEQFIICPEYAFAVATSGTFRRVSQKNEQNWHHIIDPLTLRPAITDVRLATICSTAALEADVLASCAITLGSRNAKPFVQNCGAQAMLLQCQNKAGQFQSKFGDYIQGKQPRRKETLKVDNA